MSTWYVTDQDGNEVTGSHGASKKEAQQRFVDKMHRIQEERKPWVWWLNKGFKVRRRK